MQELLQAIESAHAKAVESQDPRAKNAAALLAQAVGLFDPAAAGALRANSVGHTEPPQFSTVPPPRVTNLDAAKPIKKDVAVVEAPVAAAGEEGKNEGENEGWTATSDYLKAKEHIGQLSTVEGGLMESLSAMTPQQIAEKYTREQLEGILTANNVEYGESLTNKQLAALVKQSAKAK